MHLRNFIKISLCLSMWVTIVVKSNMICKSLQIQTLKDIQKYKNCNIIDGHLTILKMDLTSVNSLQLNLNVREISDYLLVYRVKGLKSLEIILPDLLIIRGNDLLFNQYSLMVYENQDLIDLSLKSLKRIQRGAIRIEKNPLLCFVTTVNWPSLLNNITSQHFSLKHNKPPNQCPTCNKYELNHPKDKIIEMQYCWNIGNFQNSSLKKPNNCSSKCTETCLDNFDCCDSTCSNRCATKNCTICPNFIQNGECVFKCKMFYVVLNKRECISRRSCKEHVMVTHQGMCIEKCPPNYEPDEENSSCRAICHGTFRVKTTKNLSFLKGCSMLNGSLELNLSAKKSHSISELQDAFTELREISGYLKIDHSPSIVSLSFLRSLDTIKGDQLYANKYALYVLNNAYLEDIWGTNRKVSILKGEVFFHLNPRLCFNKIIGLQSSLKTGDNITIVNVSPNSNGESVICGKSVRKMEAIVEDVNSTAARITVGYMSVNEVHVLFGYQYFYKPIFSKNVTMYDGRHGCGLDEWRLDIKMSQIRRHVITNLSPYTLYAVFVKTITPIDYYNQVEAISDILYFRTLPRKPDPVSKIYYETIETTEIIVHWWPPKKLNGEIKEYIVQYEETSPIDNYTKSFIHSKPSRLKALQCHCKDEKHLKSIVPNNEQFYNRDEKTYEDALPNVLYVAKHKPLGKSENKTLIPKVLNSSELDEVIKNFNKNKKKEALKIQDKNDSTLEIIKPPAICNNEEKKDSKKFQQPCQQLEFVKGIKVDGSQHSITLNNLKPETTYRIGVRACVRDLQNGCGEERFILAKTLNSNLEAILKSLRLP